MCSKLSLAKERKYREKMKEIFFEENKYIFIYMFKFNKSILYVYLNLFYLFISFISGLRNLIYTKF